MTCRQWNGSENPGRGGELLQRKVMEKAGPHSASVNISEGPATSVSSTSWRQPDRGQSTLMMRFNSDDATACCWQQALPHVRCCSILSDSRVRQFPARPRPHCMLWLVGRGTPRVSIMLAGWTWGPRVSIAPNTNILAHTRGHTRPHLWWTRVEQFAVHGRNGQQLPGQRGERSCQDTWSGCVCACVCMRRRGGGGDLD